MLLYINRNETNSIKYDCDIVRELKEINSFARMTDVADVKKTSYFDAAYLLGAKTNIDTEAFEKMVTSAIIDKEKMPKIPYRDKKTGKMLSKPDTGMRNFIISNVIKSRQFKYLVRYTNPRKISECAKNKKLIAFALNAIDEKQIDRYYQSCEGHTAPIEAEKKYITDVIAGMNFDDAITDLNHKADQFDPQKVKKRTVVSLYLTILYQIAKNLIYVNSRYVIAFNCLERDKILHKIGTGNDDYFSLTTKFCDNGWINERYTDILRTNIQNSDIWSIIQFRNNVDHLEIVRNIHDNIDKVTGFTSYFELYHSLMQLTIAKQYEHVKDKDRVNLSSKTKGYLENAVQHNSYCKDFVKALCSPFGYNLPRFKNLSIDGLFDMHDKRENRKTGIDD